MQVDNNLIDPIALVESFKSVFEKQRQKANPFILIKPYLQNLELFAQQYRDQANAIVRPLQELIEQSENEDDILQGNPGSNKWQVIAFCIDKAIKTRDLQIVQLNNDVKQFRDQLNQILTRRIVKKKQNEEAESQSQTEEEYEQVDNIFKDTFRWDQYTSAINRTMDRDAIIQKSNIFYVKLKSESLQDPFFQKQKAGFDQGGAAGLFMNCAGIGSQIFRPLSTCAVDQNIQAYKLTLEQLIQPQDDFQEKNQELPPHVVNMITQLNQSQGRGMQDAWKQLLADQTENQQQQQEEQDYYEPIIPPLPVQEINLPQLMPNPEINIKFENWPDEDGNNESVFDQSQNQKKTPKSKAKKQTKKQKEDTKQVKMMEYEKQDIKEVKNWLDQQKNAEFGDTMPSQNELEKPVAEKVFYLHKRLFSEFMQWGQEIDQSTEFKLEQLEEEVQLPNYVPDIDQSFEQAGQQNIKREIRTQRIEYSSDDNGDDIIVSDYDYQPGPEEDLPNQTTTGGDEPQLKTEPLLRESLIKFNKPKKQHRANQMHSIVKALQDHFQQPDCPQTFPKHYSEFYNLSDCTCQNRNNCNCQIQTISPQVHFLALLHCMTDKETTEKETINVLTVLNSINQ